jgi:hypothetical protein
MTAPKSSAKKKATAKKAATKKAPAKKKATAKKTAAKKAANDDANQDEPIAAKDTKAKKSGASSLNVIMGQLFSLRPRVSTGFRPDDFRQARQSLADESYDTPQDAARAVAEKAIELTRGGPHSGPRPRRNQ